MYLNINIFVYIFCFSLADINNELDIILHQELLPKDLAKVSLVSLGIFIIVKLTVSAFHWGTQV